MRVSVVIPNYNGRELLAKNLNKVIAACPDSEIIVVDDASTDDSLAFLSKEFPSVRVVARKENRGFAASVNDGVAKALGDIIFLLNSDAYPQQEALETAVAHFADTSVFAVGLLQKSREDGAEVLRGRGIGTFHRGFLVHAKGSTDKKNTLWASGGAALFSKKIWQKLGGMAGLYNPFYWEDVDISYLAAKSGYRVVFEPGASVVHEQSIGSIRTHYSPHTIKTISYRNQFYFVWVSLDASYLFWHVTVLPLYLLKAFFTGDWAYIVGFIKAADHWGPVIRLRKIRKSLWKKSDREVLAPFSEEMRAVLYYKNSG